MKLDEIQKNIEKISIENWNKSFGGTASSEIANKIEIDNSIVMRAMEDLVAANYGTINANVELSQISIDSETREFEFTPIKVHIYFPSKQMLEEFFYSRACPHLALHQINIQAIQIIDL